MNEKIKMTREQAINYLISSGFSEEQVSEVVRALTYEPTTKNDLGVDAASRQAINGYIDYILSHGMGKKKSFDFIKKFVANLPSVTPQEPCDKCEVGNPCLYCKHEFEAKTGHWILTDDDFAYCSECEDSYYPRPIDASWYYCPHCGCRMVEPQESEDGYENISSL